MRLAAYLAVLLIGSLGIAAPPKSLSAEQKNRAKAAFQRAQTDYTLGRFDEALKEYSAAYEAAPYPDFLFNIGQCHRQLKNYERAVFFFEGYLREKPDAPNRKLVTDLIEESKAALADRAAQDKAAREQAVTQQRVAEQRAVEIVAAKPVDITAPPSNEAAPVSDPPVYGRWWFWTAAGAVVLGGAAAIVISTQSAGGEGARLPEHSLGVLDRR